MSEVLTGYFAYIISNNNVATFLFVGFLAMLFGMLIWMQMRRDTFDLRAIISNYVVVDGEGRYVPATDKTLLVGTWVVTSYLVIEHYTDAALLAYGTLWVVNGGVVVLAKYGKLAGDK